MGIFGNLFSSESDELNKVIDKWIGMLTPQYKNLWQQWIAKRDIVAKEMRLSDVDVARLTCREASKYAAFSLKRQIGLTESTKETVIKTRGNTWAFQNMKAAMDDYEKYSRLVNRTISLEKFDKAIDKVGTRR